MRNPASGMPAHAPTAQQSSPKYPAGQYLTDPGCSVIYRGQEPVLRSLASIHRGACDTQGQADALAHLFAAAPVMHAALHDALLVVAGCNADGAFDYAERTIRAALDLVDGGAAA